MPEDRSIEHQLRLSIANWGVVIGAFALVLVAWYVVPIILGAAATGAELATYVVGAFALSGSAYAAISTSRLRRFELDRGYRSARSLVEADAYDALRDAAELFERAMLIEDTERDKWAALLHDLNAGEQRYERKQDQLAPLSSQLPPDEYLKVRELYRAIEEIWRHSSRWTLPAGTQADTQAILPTRRKHLTEHLTRAGRGVLGRCQELGLESLPPDYSFSCLTEHSIRDAFTRPFDLPFDFCPPYPFYYSFGGPYHGQGTIY